jgi:hypothetical protein
MLLSLLQRCHIDDLHIFKKTDYRHISERKEDKPMVCKEQTNPKKTWTPPAVTVYGDVEELTQQSKVKQPGSSDDFHVSGVSNFP